MSRSPREEPTTSKFGHTFPLPKGSAEDEIDTTRQPLPVFVDRPGLDTRLARFLHEKGRLDLRALHGALVAARMARPQGGVTLARALVDERWLSLDEAEAFLMHVADSDPLENTWDQPTVAKASAEDHAPWVEPWGPGDRIGDCVLLEQLGTGAMGVVFKARHEPSGDEVALKAIAPIADSELVQRFAREAAAQARVGAHPHLVRVRGQGSHQDRGYIVMDLVEGQELRDLIRQGPIEPREAARIVRSLASALAHLHARGVLHRDIKPANVLLDQNLEPKLADFGIAHVDGAHTLTATGAQIGTPAYMSPEQALGLRDQTGPRSDVYALCTVLYELLTGAPPFLAKSTITLLTKIVQSEPDGVRSLRKDVPADLETICMRGLSKAPEERFTALELTELLDRFLRGDSLEDTPPEKKRVITPTTVGAVLFAAGFGFGIWSSLDKQASSDPDPGDDPPAAVVTTQEAPPPDDPQQAVVPNLVFPVGSSRYELTVQADLTTSPFGSSTTTVELLNQITMDWEVTEDGEAGYLVAATVRALVVDWSMSSSAQQGWNPEPMSYDSRRVLDHPFDRALGRTFQFRIDAMTGDVSRVSGVAPIQSAITDSAPVGDTMRYRIPAFSSPLTMRSFLGATLDGLGTAPDVLEWQAERPTPLLFGSREEQREPSGLKRQETPTVLGRFSSRTSEEGQRTVTWGGSQRVTTRPYEWTPERRAGPPITYQVSQSASRELNGHAELTSGVLQSGSVQETWELLRVFRVDREQQAPTKVHLRIELRRDR